MAYAKNLGNTIQTIYSFIAGQTASIDIPSGATNYRVTLKGGGSGGGGGNYSTANAGGGEGALGIFIGGVGSATKYSYTIGNGGDGGSDTAVYETTNPGRDGGNTAFILYEGSAVVVTVLQNGATACGWGTGGVGGVSMPTSVPLNFTVVSGYSYFVKAINNTNGATGGTRHLHPGYSWNDGGDGGGYPNNGGYRGVMVLTSPVVTATAGSPGKLGGGGGGAGGGGGGLNTGGRGGDGFIIIEWF